MRLDYARPMSETIVLTVYRPLPKAFNDTLCQGPEGEPREPQHVADRMVEASNGDYWYACGEHENGGY